MPPWSCHHHASFFGLHTVLTPMIGDPPTFCPITLPADVEAEHVSPQLPDVWLLSLLYSTPCAEPCRNRPLDTCINESAAPQALMSGEAVLNGAGPATG